MVARFTWLFFCVFGSFFFLGWSIENGHTTTKPEKLRTIFWHFCIQGIFSKKTFCPSCLGFSFGRPASERRHFPLVFTTPKTKVDARNATKIGISGLQPGWPLSGASVFTVLGFWVRALLRKNIHMGVWRLFLSKPAKTHFAL